MRISKFARAAAALVMPAGGRGQGRTRRLRPVTARPGRARVAAIAATLLVPAALAATAATAAAAPALASTAPLAITTTTPLTATAGSAFAAKLDATGGTKPSTFTVSVTDSENPPVTVTQAGSITVTGGTVTGGTFPVGNDPDAIAFDGTNMWVTNAGGGTVTELSPTGATLGTFPVGNNPDAVAFGGTSRWVANGGDNTVTEVPRPADRGSSVTQLVTQRQRRRLHERSRRLQASGRYWIEPVTSSVGTSGSKVNARRPGWCG